jgi:hypothetical protein
MRLILKSLVALSLLTAQAAAESVDLELVFAADGSGSIDDEELRLQRRGWADALTSPDVLTGIKDGPVGAIAVAFMEWGGPNSQVLIVDWHVIRDEASARVFADRLMSAPRGAYGYNSISNAIDFSVRLVETNAHEGTRKVIDVSGDGPNMNGRSLEQARADALAKGFTINALAIRRPGSGRPGLLWPERHRRPRLLRGDRRRDASLRRGGAAQAPDGNRRNRRRLAPCQPVKFMVGA